MARQGPHLEYIVTEDSYKLALASLPITGMEQQKAQSVKIMAREYRQNTSQTINAGKWVMWNIVPESFEFEWRNGAWQPPTNLVVLTG